MSKHHKHKRRESESYQEQDFQNRGNLNGPYYGNNMMGGNMNQGMNPNMNPNMNQGMNQGMNQNPNFNGNQQMNQFNPMMNNGNINNGNMGNNMMNNPIGWLLQNASNNPLMQLLSNIDFNLLYQLLMGNKSTNSISSAMNNLMNNSSMKNNNTVSSLDDLDFSDLDTSSKDNDTLENNNTKDNDFINQAFSSNMIGETLAALLRNLDEQGTEELVKSVDEDKINSIMKEFGFDNDYFEKEKQPRKEDDKEEFSKETKENKSSSGVVYIKSSTIPFMAGAAYYSDSSTMGVEENKYYASEVMRVIIDLCDPKNADFLDEVVKLHRDFYGENEKTTVIDESISENINIDEVEDAQIISHKTKEDIEDTEENDLDIEVNNEILEDAAVGIQENKEEV